MYVQPVRMVYGGGGRDGRITAEEVAEAYPWPDSGPWVRAMMVTTLDGAAAGPDGLSGSVTSPADQLVFDAVRRYADVVLVGSGTLRSEEYSPMRAKAADGPRRAEHGQLPAPVVAVVSGSLNLPWHLPIWAESTHRPLVITSVGANNDRLKVARTHAEVIVVEEIAPRTVVDALVGCGLRRIVCEGGPRLLRDFVAADLVDEADITLVPLFAGTGASPSTAVLPAVVRYRLMHVLQDDGALMMRYLVEGG